MAFLFFQIINFLTKPSAYGGLISGKGLAIRIKKNCFISKKKSGSNTKGILTIL